jgi:hypothetical protein
MDSTRLKSKLPCVMPAPFSFWLQTAPEHPGGNAFMGDVHMDSGRISKAWVSSLAAFVPGMQALVGEGMGQ